MPLVTDTGFHPDTYSGEILDLASDADPDALDTSTTQMIRIDFPSFADGRGLTLARLLRLRGFSGRLRARGHVIADQYAMVRRAGFDEVEIDDTLAKRQPQAQWIARANWQEHNYQARLRGQLGINPE